MVLDRRCRTSEIVYLVNFCEQRLGHIVLQQRKTLAVDGFLGISCRSGRKLPVQTTLYPSPMRRLHKCDPRKPAPPVTRIFLICWVMFHSWSDWMGHGHRVCHLHFNRHSTRRSLPRVGLLRSAKTIVTLGSHRCFANRLTNCARALLANSGVQLRSNKSSILLDAL